MKKSSRLKDLYLGLLYALIIMGMVGGAYYYGTGKPSKKVVQKIEESFHTQELNKILALGLVQPEFMFNNANSFVDATGKCVEYLNEKGIMHTRYGLDALFDIPKNEFLKLPPHIARTPDYVAFVSKAIFIEAKGCHDILKLKEDDMKAYDWWQEIMPITMFVYSTTEQNHKLVAYRELREIALKGKTGRYPDNNKLYYEIPWETI